MSKITIEFDTSGDDGIYEAESAKRAIHADDAFGLVWDITQAIRDHLKYGNPASPVKTLESINEMIYDSKLLDLWS
jgi:hypothetical protein